MNWNLNDYETVETRLEKWHSKYPNSRVRTKLLSSDDNRFIVFCELFSAGAATVPADLTPDPDTLAPLTRENLAAHTVEVLNRGGWGNPDVLLVRSGGVD